jgi:hypothetical protein
MKTHHIRENIIREKGIPIYLKKMRIEKISKDFIPTYYYKAVKK